MSSRAAGFLVLTTVLLSWPSVARAVWRAPVGGPVVAAYRYSASEPFAAGRRRGIELRARRGEAVRAACGGPVTHAGRVPGWRLGVTVRCGGLVATHLGLAGVGVRRGDAVRAGARIGAAAGPVLRLGARHAGRRHGYVDPAGLLGRARPTRPRWPVGPPAGRASRGPLGPAPARRPAPARGPVVTPRPVPVAGRDPVAHPGRAAAAIPALAWLGLGLLAVAVPGGIALQGRRRRRAATACSASAERA